MTFTQQKWNRILEGWILACVSSLCEIQWCCHPGKRISPSKREESMCICGGVTEKHWHSETLDQTHTLGHLSFLTLDPSFFFPLLLADLWLCRCVNVNDLDRRYRERSALIVHFSLYFSFPFKGWRCLKSVLKRPLNYLRNILSHLDFFLLWEKKALK